MDAVPAAEARPADPARKAPGEAIVRFAAENPASVAGN